MSREKFNDDCPGCRPVLLDAKTRQKMPDNSPERVAILKVWNQTTRDEREAFHRVTCDNSRDPSDIAVIQSLSKRFEKALQK